MPSACSKGGRLKAVAETRSGGGAALLLDQRSGCSAAVAIGTAFYLDRLIAVQAFLQNLNQVDHIGGSSLYLDLGRELLLVSFLLDHLHHGIPIFVPIFLWLPHARHAFNKGVRHL